MEFLSLSRRHVPLRETSPATKSEEKRMFRRRTLQTFYNSWLILFYRDITMPCLYHFPEILQCPACTILQGLLLIPCEIYQENPGISQEFPRIIPGTSMNILRVNLHQHSLKFSGLYWNRNRLKILGNFWEWNGSFLIVGILANFREQEHWQVPENSQEFPNQLYFKNVWKVVKICCILMIKKQFLSQFGVFLLYFTNKTQMVIGA